MNSIPFHRELFFLKKFLTCGEQSAVTIAPSPNTLDNFARVRGNMEVATSMMERYLSDQRYLAMKGNEEKARIEEENLKKALEKKIPEIDWEKSAASNGKSLKRKRQDKGKKKWQSGSKRSECHSDNSEKEKKIDSNLKKDIKRLQT